MRATRPRVYRVAAFLGLDSEHGRGILRGIARFFRHRSNVTVLKFNQTEHYAVGRLSALEVDGIIAKVGSRRDERILRASGIPLVNISGHIGTPLIPTVNTDDLLVGRLTFDHLHARGYRTFAYAGCKSHLGSRLRHEGFAAAAKRVGAAVATLDLLPWTDSADPYPREVRSRLTEWISRLRKPVAVFAFTDRVALEIDDVCHDLNLRVPHDVAILGVGNDLTRLEFAHVEISCLQLNTQGIGYLAAETLDRLMRGDRAVPPESLLRPLKIITRRSTDHFAVADEVVATALDHIRDNEANTVYVGEVARVAGVSRRSLEARFRRVLNSTVNAEIVRSHLNRALVLMAEPDLNIGEIADAAGFGSAKQFCVTFRRVFGTSPTAHRAKLAEKPAMVESGSLAPARGHRA